MPVSTPSLRPLTAFVGVFALAAACAGTLIWTLESQDRAEQRSQAADMAGDHVQALQRAIELALSANNALVALVRQGRGSVPQFEEIGTQMLPFYPGIAAMGLSPSGVVRQVVPRQGNEGAMDFDMLHDPQQGTESAHARASGRLTLAGPMELAQGGLGVVGRQPVYLDDEQGQRSFWGFTYVAIRLPDVLAAARLDQLTARGYRYRLWRVRPDNGQEQTIAASTPPAGAGAMSRSLALPNGQWTLGLTPAQGWGAAGVLALRCALGLLFALLMAYLARLLFALKAHERGLADQVAQRISEIQATQQQLRATIDAIPDPLFEIDQDGRYCSVHSQRAELLMGPAEQLIGRNVTEVLPTLAALSVLDVLHEAQAQGWSVGRQIMLDLPDLGPTWFELSAARKPQAAGAKPRIILLSRDITERKRSQEQLQLTAQVFDQSSEAIVIADASHRIVRINRAFSRITGYQESEAVGQSVRLLTMAEAGPDCNADAVYARLARQERWEGESWGRRKDGSGYPQWLSVSSVRDGDANGPITHSITLFRDISLQREAQERIQRLAHFDPLTDLPNRVLLAERTQRQIAQEQARGGQLALLFLDLDHFKNVNDSLGHRIGDILLVAVARRLQSLIGPQDTVSRLGGDEFLLLLPATSAAHAAKVASALLTAVAQPFQIDPYELSTTLSVGIAMCPADGESFDTLYQRADAAMYSAKQSGRNRYGFFTADLQARTARALQIENALRRALERQQFELHYQPQVSLGTGQVVGAEALLRWRHPELGVVAPAEFIPVAENSGQIVALGEWVLHTAARDAKRWLDMQLPLRAVSVNLSAVQFRHPQLPEMVTRCLQQAGLPARRLELELTEGAAVDDPVAALAMMDQLHDRGVRLSMDDFGTGYSSLSCLKRFQIYKLKIDQSFVRDLDDDANDRAIVSAIIRMAQALGMQTTAEGVETDGQLQFLRAQGCDEGQGYLFSRPLPADAFEAYLRAMK
ncbi:bifunctional diguanylate cyclase/phosphodiesterase [Verminephrobacter eiseniae]|uniref:bifunctional diguanylate cyclase/phosphodiesterase n=1 Tax=Verminephrobacter eiseniae TaxID=364317 RepID=UPI0022370154|nr:EAL domain-containing protein [Verminephrobacter eiseniae]MCW5233194.1 EAL domain-containing protein [Verminephrobacter eiseniae]MCW5295251.1 EAL domain-containing protein [Verminephrobacter eiseniae]MCW8185654.1 EAL domain-containing protein [Verminephrobacter eiseniae]MCW8225201.1 EAL domain-containing protein [Verminephrobacter eiseniae]MCW8235453.1 EAL domain-containing protein [Verminephrobacter eiseniae]